MSDKRFRRFVRKPVAVEIQVRDSDEAGGEIFFDSVDISEGGAYIRSDLLLELGDRLEVTFRLPDNSVAIVARARVVWVTPHEDIKGDAGFGIEFLDLTASEQKQIAGFVSSV